MDKKRNTILGVAALATLIAAYSLVLFMFRQEKNDVFWSVYAFTMTAFLVQFLTVYFIGVGHPAAKDIFLGLPLVKHGLVYLLVQFVAGIILLLIEDCGIKAAMAVQIVILAAFIIFAILAMVGKNVISADEQLVSQKVFYIKSLEADVQGFAQRCNEPAMCKSLFALAETIRFSDPMSHSSLASIENTIERKTAELGISLEQGNLAGAKAGAQELEMLFADRNRKCKLLK